MRLLLLFTVTSFLAFASATSPVVAHDDHSHDGALEVHDAWVRPTNGRKTSAGAYFMLHNTGEDAVAIIGATSNVSTITDLHETKEVDGVMRMRPAGDLVIAPGAHLAFEPGGLHVMLIDLERPLAAGETITVTLDLLNHDPVEITVPVQATAPEGHHSHSADHGHH